MLIIWIITWAIWFFDLRKKKFFPARAKFYWGLIIIFLPYIGWFAYFVYGRKKHILRGELFYYGNDLPLEER